MRGCLPVLIWWPFGPFACNFRLYKFFLTLFYTKKEDFNVSNEFEHQDYEKGLFVGFIVSLSSLFNFEGMRWPLSRLLVHVLKIRRKMIPKKSFNVFRWLIRDKKYICWLVFIIKQNWNFHKKQSNYKHLFLYYYSWVNVNPIYRT